MTLNHKFRNALVELCWKLVWAVRYGSADLFDSQQVRLRMLCAFYCPCSARRFNLARCDLACTAI